MKRGFSEKLIRSEILRARKFHRSELLTEKPKEVNESKLTFNITYHPAFNCVKEILARIHLLLVPDDEHQSVFQNIPIVGFKRGKSLKDFLVRAKIKVQSGEGESKECKGSRCDVCKIINTTSTFDDSEGKDQFVIKGGDSKCSLSNVVYQVV